MSDFTKMSLGEYVYGNTGDMTYKNKTYHGHCSKCGVCCSTFIPLCNEDISRIKNYLLIHKIVPEHKGEKNVLDMMCPFLSRKKQCLIYEVRPLICRTFKCNRTIPQLIKKYGHLFLNKIMSIKDMWNVFFYENRPTSIVLKEILKRKNNHGDFNNAQI